jgi:hypothetical protein
LYRLRFILAGKLVLCGITAKAVGLTGGCVVSELLTAASQALLPFVAAGAGAVAVGTAEEAGAELYRAATSLLSRIRHRLAGQERVDIEVALRDALHDGSVTEDDLVHLRNVHEAYQQAVHIHVKRIDAKNAFLGTTNIRNFEA